MKSIKIKTKLRVLFAIAISSSFLIGLFGFIAIFRMNQTITNNDYLIVQPLVYLSKINSDLDKINSLTRDTIIAGGAGQDELYTSIRGYHNDLRVQINAYMENMDVRGQTETDEYVKLSDLSGKVSFWSAGMKSVADLSKNENTIADAVELNAGLASDGDKITAICQELIDLNEKKAADSRDAAQRTFVLISALILGLFAVDAALTVFLSLMLTRSITKSVSSIVTAAEELADGDTHIRQDLPDDEMGQIGRALVRVADSISNLIADNNKVFSGVGAGLLNFAVDESKYKGDYYDLSHSINMTMQALRGHLDVIPTALSFFDSAGGFLYGNRAMLDFLPIFGLDCQSPLILHKILSAESPETVEDAMEIFGDGKQDKFSANISVSGGDSYTFKASLHRVIDAKSKLSCVILTMADITDITHAQNEAVRANRAKSDFLSNMSHEIRTPLNAIIGMTQIARRSDTLSKALECADKIENSSHHLLELINNILDMSKIEAGKLTLSCEEVSLSNEVEFVVNMMRSKANENNVRIIYDVDIAQNFVLADKLRLNQVMINLIGNAIKFSPNGGTINLSVKQTESGGDHSYYLFSIADTGIGMSEEQLSRLFKAFEQADMGISKRFGGTGLGLSISKTIVEMMNGKIWVSSSPGQGSTFSFTVRLAAAKSAAENALNIENSENDFSSVTILLADDIEINRLIVTELLAETGIKIDEAVNGSEAVDLFKNSPKGHYGLIFMDIQMPEMDGIEATKIIRAMSRSDAKTVPIIAMTANVMKSDVEKVLAAGMDGHIGKPIDFDTVVKTIREITAKE